MDIREFQRRIEAIYGAKDAARGSPATFQWLVEEVGELAQALRRGNASQIREEFADCLAWLSTLASMHGVDLEDAAQSKYPGMCIKCGESPCACAEPAGFSGPVSAGPMEQIT
jgi:NTP pyrophosphatase (non-canonical NTP hydrolase)